VNNISEIGSPRSLWEGGKKGEGLLQEIKLHIHGMKSNWMYTAMKRVAQDRSFNIIGDSDIFCSDASNGDMNENVWNNLFASYSSWEKFTEDRNAGHPIS